MLSDAEQDAKLNELDRILNDPDVVMEPARVWSLLAEISASLPLPLELNGETAYARGEGGRAERTAPTAAMAF